MNLQELLNNPLFGGGVALSLFGGAIYMLKELPAKLWAWLIRQYIHTVRVYDYDDMFHILAKWLYKNHSQSYKEVEARLDDGSSLPRPLGESGPKKADITLKQEPSTFWLKIDGRWLLISSIKETLEHAESSLKRYSSSYSIRGFRCRAAIKEFLERIANEYYSKLAANQISIYYNSEWGEWVRASPIRIKPIDKIILAGGLKKEIIDDIITFKKSKDWYYQMCIPYKRQYVFHGDPGTGKTSLSLAISAYLNVDVFVMNIKSLQSDAAMQRAFNIITPGAVLLIEDIDASFNKRESANENVSFSSLINCMDGAFYKDGLITCITTNHLDKLDPALIRPGRTDKVIEVGHPKDQQIEEFISQFYGTELHFWSSDSCLISMSTIQECCLANRNDPAAALLKIRSIIISKTETQCAQIPSTLKN